MRRHERPLPARISVKLSERVKPLFTLVEK